jgi:hypothetical protein
MLPLGQDRPFQLVIASADSTPVPRPSPLDPDMHVWRDAAGNVLCYGHLLGQDRWIHLPGLASYRFEPRSGVVTAFPTPGAKPAEIEDGYRRRVLPMVQHSLGRELLHSSAIVTPHGVLVLCGAAQTGKSTIAYGLACRGHQLWADDTVVWEPRAEGIHAIPLPFRVRLRPPAVAFFGHDPSSRMAGRGEESETVPHASAPLAGLCLLQRIPHAPAGPAVQVRRLAPARAFFAVLAHADAFFLPDKDRVRQMVERYLDLTAQVPVFELNFQPGLEKLAVVLDEIETIVRSCQGDSQSDSLLPSPSRAAGVRP